MASETTAQTNAAGPGSARPQPVAMEIPVTVNGARTVAGGEKREPFSEATQTVLVFGSGAVIRLAAAVGPGQLLFVTNEKSKQEVVCQVVKTKQNGNAAGYVELKFTEATTDFWGIRAPGNGAAAPAAPSVGAVGTPAKPLEQNLTNVKNAAPAAVQANSVQVAPPQAAVVAASTPVVAQPAAPVNKIQAAPVDPAQPPALKVPTLSEFLTHGSNGPELKARDKQETAKIENRGTATAVLTANKPVHAPSALPPAAGEHDNKPSLSVALGVGQSPAPGSASFDLSADLPAEEVKIPSWLEPLARNSGAVENRPIDTKTSEAGAGDVSNVELHREEKIAALSEPVEVQEAAPVLAGEGRAPNFGTSLALGSQKDVSGSSGKGLKIALAIAALLIAAAAAWYWFVNQAPKVSAGGIGTLAESNPASVPAPEVRDSLIEPTRSSAGNSGDLLAQPVSQSTMATLPSARASADLNSHVASSVTKNAASRNPADTPEEVVVEEPAKKPKLGKVRLAAPKIMRGAAESETGTADPGLVINSVTAADSSGASMLTNKGKGPAAPLPVGGDVKVAKLVSSVPPVYPQMARTQRVSGDVTIDALIDGSGRVTATRVLSGPALLHDAATTAVRQWKYQPATLNGLPTATHLTVTVQFRLQ